MFSKRKRVSQVLCVDFFLKVVYYEALSPFTSLAAVLLIVFSAAVLLEYLTDKGENEHANHRRSLVGLHVRHGARRV